MEQTSDQELLAEYGRRTAAIRAIEADLRRELLEPAVALPGVMDAALRIRPFEAIRQRLMAGGWDAAPPLLGVRLVIFDASAAEQVMAQVRNAYQVIAQRVDREIALGLDGTYRANITLAYPFKEEAEPRYFELLLVSSLSQTLAELQHALNYKGGVPPGAPRAVRVGPFASAGPGPARRLPTLRSLADRLSRDIDRFVDLIDLPDVHEKSDVHPYLQQHPFILHPGPEAFLSEVPIGLGTQFWMDFMIREPIGDYTLVEIENPNRPLFTQKGNLTAHVTHAVQQVEDWQEWIENNVQTMQRVYPGIIAPVGLVVIGRSNNLDAVQLGKLARHNINRRGRLRLETYDMLIARARAYVEGLLNQIARIDAETEA